MAVRTPPLPNAPTEDQSAESADTPRAARPWRTEGLPKSPQPKPRQRWITIAIWGVGYLLLFGTLTVQDRLSGPQPVPYTEAKSPL